MFCGKCGREISENMKFCPKCGTPVSVVSIEEPKKEKKKSKKWIMILSLILVIAVGTGVAGAVFLQRKGNGKFDKNIVLPYPVNENGKMVWGLVDGTGKEILKPQYDDILENDGNHYFIVVQGNKKGVIDAEGNELLEPIYEEIHPWYDNKDALVIIQNEKEGLYNAKKKEMIFPVEYEHISWNTYSVNGIIGEWIQLEKEDDNKWALGNIETGELLGDDSRSVSYYQPNVNLAEINEDYHLYGLINDTGEEVVPCKYDGISTFSDEGYACVIKNGHAGIINTDGIVTAEVEGEFTGFPYFFDRGNANAFVLEREDGLLIVDAKGNEILSCGDAEGQGIYEDGKILLLYKKGKYGCMDSTGKTMIPFEYENLVMSQLYPGIAVAEKNNRWEILDMKGKVKQKISVDMETVSAFNQNGVAIFKDGHGKFGLINAKGIVLTTANQDGEERLGLENGAYDTVIETHIGTTEYNPMSGLVKIRDDNGFQIKNEDGKVLLSDEKKSLVKLYGTYALIEKDGAYHYVEVKSKKTMKVDVKESKAEQTGEKDSAEDSRKEADLTEQQRKMLEEIVTGFEYDDDEILHKWVSGKDLNILLSQMEVNPYIYTPDAGDDKLGIYEMDEGGGICLYYGNLSESLKREGFGKWFGRSFNDSGTEFYFLYQGEWESDMPNGKGKYTEDFLKKDFKTIYQGEFDMGNIDGSIHLNWFEGDDGYEGEFHACKGVPDKLPENQIEIEENAYIYVIDEERGRWMGLRIEDDDMSSCRICVPYVTRLSLKWKWNIDDYK